MERLTSKQRAYLRSLAQRLRPVVFVGKEGISDAVVQAASEALAAHELIKIRVLRGSPLAASAAIAALAARLPGAHAVQAIGHVGVLYRPHPERPTIVLPPPRPGPNQ
jgi:RNA-binding protein